MRRPGDDRRLRLAAALGVDRAWRCGRVGALGVRSGLSAARLDGLLWPGAMALVTGPSGSGKSTLLRALASRCAGRAAVVRGLTRTQARRPVACLSARLSLERWAGVLARFGLADAGVLLADAGELSAGERARLEVALAAARLEAALVPGHGGTLIADEWCSPLDRPLAGALTGGAARWARERGARVVAAAAHVSGVVERADVVVTLDGQGGERWTACASNPAA